MVQQTTRRGDQNLDTGFQLNGLRLHVHAAKHHRAADLGVFCVGFNLLGDLISQLARGQQYQSAYWVASRRSGSVFVLQHALNQRERESGRFTSTGLGGAHHVSAFQNHRNRLRLDGGHGFVAHVGDGACQRRG